jgi:hypothetical protein
MSSNNNVPPSSSNTSVAAASTPPRSIVALETAARDTISQALVVWKGSATMQTNRSRDRCGSQPSTTSGESILYPKVKQTLDHLVLIAVCGMRGSGKSNFISTLVGMDVGIENGRRSSKLGDDPLSFASLTVAT